MALITIESRMALIKFHILSAMECLGEIILYYRHYLHLALNIAMIINIIVIVGRCETDLGRATLLIDDPHICELYRENINVEVTICGADRCIFASYPSRCVSARIVRVESNTDTGCFIQVE